MIAIQRELQFESFITLWLFVQLLHGALLGGLCCKVISPPSLPSKALVVATWQYGIRSYGVSLTEVATMRMDQLILTIIAPSSALALYSLTMQGTELILLVISSFSAVLFSHVLKLPRQSAIIKLQVTIREVVRLGIPAATGLGIAIAIGLPRVFGPEYSGGAWAAMFLSWAALAFGVGQLYGIGLMMLNRPGLASASQCAALLLIPLGMAIITRYFPVTGTAIVTFIAYLAFAIMSLVLYRYICERVSEESS